MRLDPSKKHYEQEWGWVGHPDASSDPGSVERLLVDRRFDIEIIGGITDDDACYSYDDWALCLLDGNYFLLSTSGCSCPSPTETWGVEIGPATVSEIRDHVLSGAYGGYTLPKKQEKDFLELLDSAEKAT